VRKRVPLRLQRDNESQVTNRSKESPRARRRYRNAFSKIPILSRWLQALCKAAAPSELQ
jgi:hypothetical protein